MGVVDSGFILWIHVMYVLGIIREMAGQSCLVSLLGNLPDQKSSLHSLLQGMEGQARIMVDRIGKGGKMEEISNI